MTADGGARRRSRRATRTGAALALGGGLLLAACSSSPSGSPSTSSTTSAATSASSASGSGGSSALRTLIDHLQGAEGSSFKVVYLVSASGKSQIFTVAQDPPKSAIVTSNGSVIDTGTQTLTCTTSPPAKCVALTGSSPLAAFTDLFDPKAVITALGAYETSGGDVAGVSVKTSTTTYGGQPSDCVTVTGKSGQVGTWCATSNGVLSYASTPTADVTLQSYSSSVSPSEFQPPAGATVVTLPAGA